MAAYKIFWNDKEVGQLTNLVPDMWYVEGDWNPKDSFSAIEFDNLLKALVIKEVFTDYSKGVRIVFNPETEPDYFGQAIAYGLTGNRLLIRRFTEKLV